MTKKKLDISRTESYKPLPDTALYTRPSRDTIVDTVGALEESRDSPRNPKMGDITRLSDIYAGMSEDSYKRNALSDLNNFSKTMARSSRHGGQVNPAFIDDEDDSDSDADANCRSESETDIDIPSSSPSSSSRPVSYDDVPIANGRVLGNGKDFKVDFASIKERRHAPPAPSKPKEKRPWDRFTTTPNDNFSSDDKQFWDRIFVVTKIIVTILLFGLTLVTAVISKICFIVISANMLPPRDNNTNVNGNTSLVSNLLKTANGRLTYYPNSHSIYKDEDMSKHFGETNVMWIWAMVTLVGAPYFFTFCRNFWRIWAQLGKVGTPSFYTIILVLLVETVHTAGLGITVFVVVPNLDPLSGLLVTLCMGVVPGVLKVVYPTVKKSELKDQNQSTMSYYLGNCVNFIGAFGQLGAIAAWCYHVYTCHGKLDNIGYFACLILAPILTSVHWWENFVHEGKPESTGLPLLARHIRKCRTKLTLYASIWKMGLIILIPLAIYGGPCADCVHVLFYEKDNAFVNTTIINTNLTSTKDFGKCYSQLPILIAVVGALCSGICFKVGKMGCKIMTQVVDYSLPLVLSTPATVGVIFAMYGGFLKLDPYNKADECAIPFPEWSQGADAYFHDLMTGHVYWLNVIAGLAGFLSILIVTNYIWYPGKERLQRTDKLFVQPLYCGVMTDISLMLNRRRIEKVNTSDSRKSTLKKTNKKLFDDGTNVDLEEKSVFTAQDTPIIYMCATMWHETQNEMTQLLKSVFRMDEDQCTRKNTQFLLNRKDPDYYEFEAHIFFDDAFEKHNDDQYDFTVNEYVKLLVKTVQFSASAINGTNYKIKPPVKMGTPYGGRLVWKLPGGNKLVAHLKDKTVIRHRKRWSQVMYMYYFLAYQLFNEEISRKALKRRAMNTYLLALDGDVDFHPHAVQLLVDRMKKNPDVGAACGRIHPIGNGAMVWYQKFEYAVSHWLQKAAEDKLGCVLCSPGCFSMFRGSALMDDNVMNKYTTPPTEPRHHVQYDQGEDRWLCTLLLQQGHRVEYCAASDALTYAPEGFYEFYNQRRRWMPSTMANIMDLLGDWKNVTEKNTEISLLYVFYQGLLMVSSILTPGTIFLMILGAIEMAYPGIDLWMSLVINLIPVVIMVILCFVANEQKQLTYAAVLSTLYSLVMMIVIVGLLVQASKFGICSITTVFISFVGGVFVLSALIHPQEFWCIIHGFLYFLAIPSMSMILMIYSLGNLQVVTWGTRENTAGVPAKPKKNKKLPKFLQSVGQYLPWVSTGDHPEDDSLRAILSRLDGIEDQIHRLSEAGSRFSDINQGRFSDITRGSPGDRQSLVHRSVSPYLAGEGNGEKFSQVNGLLTGAGERENPMYQPEKPVPRDMLVDPFWMTDDTDFEKCKAETLDEEEVKFWGELIEEYLLPIKANAEKQAKMQADLIELRNKVCLIFILINSLFIIVVFTLQQVVGSTDSMSILLPCADPDAPADVRHGQSIEPISVAFTLVFGLLLFVQFICMLMHRMATLLHICASTEIFKKKRKIRPIGHEEDGAEEAEDVEEYSYDQVYEMVRDMQKDQEADSVSITSESSYAPSEVDEEEDETRAREEAKQRWKKLAKRRTKVTHNTLHTNFMKNVETMQRVMSEKYVNKPDSEEDEEVFENKIKKEANFSRLRPKSLHVLASMSRDKSIMQRQLTRKRVQNRFKMAASKLNGTKKTFIDVVKVAQLQKEREKIESEAIEMDDMRDENDDDIVVDEAADITNVKATYNLRMEADEQGRQSRSTVRSLTEEELAIHIPKADDDDVWPDEGEYIHHDQTVDIVASEKL